jgi:Tol biopolymer transport system component
MRYTTSRAADIWIADVDRGGASRFTSAPGQNQDVVWSPDGNRVVFSSNRNGPRDFFVKPASGAAPEEILHASTIQFKDPYSWSPDGKFIVFQQADPQTKDDLWLLPLDGDRTPKPYLRTSFAENYGRISPDGRWMMYASDESGRLEIYVDSFPTPRNRYRVTDRGGVSGYWRKDGRELAIVSADVRSLFMADVLPGEEFRATSPRQIALPKDTVWVQPTPDFQRFLASVPIVESRTSSLTVIFDWPGALRKK